MDLLIHFKGMAANNTFANDRLLHACEGLSDAEFIAPRTGFFPSLCETLNHILEVDRYYYDALSQGGAGLTALSTPAITSPWALRAAQARQDGLLEVYCASLSPDMLTEMVATDRGDEGIVHERVCDVLAHLFQHQIHHRGQAHAMLAETSVAPPQLDEFFLAYDNNPAMVR
ncbi:MAG: DinB family protein [Pseudomonadota bacterium]